MARLIDFPFLPIHLRLRSHPKILKFKRRHGPGSWHDIIGLWIWVANDRPDGNLAGMDSEEIETAAEWRGTPGSMVQSMLDCGLLDGEAGNYRIHDWTDWAEYFSQAHNRQEDAHRKRVERSREKPGDLRNMSENVQPQPDNVHDAPDISGHLSRREEKRREESRSEDPSSLVPEKQARARKPLSEQAGLIGTHAKDWKESHGGIEPTWDAGPIIAYNKKRSKNGTIPDENYAIAFRLFCADEWWRDKQHPFDGFVRNLDKYLAMAAAPAQPKKWRPNISDRMAAVLGDRSRLEE